MNDIVHVLTEIYMGLVNLTCYVLRDISVHKKMFVVEFDVTVYPCHTG